jgi:hypothetical protein
VLPHRREFPCSSPRSHKGAERKRIQAYIAAHKDHVCGVFHIAGGGKAQGGENRSGASPLATSVSSSRSLGRPCAR